MPSGIFLLPGDMIPLCGAVSKNSAWYVYDTIRRKIGKPRGLFFTIDEFCQHKQVSRDEVMRALGVTEKKLIQL